MSENDGVVLFEVIDGGIALITLNRPTKKNALNAEVLFELKSAFEEVKRNPAIRCAIITGQCDVFSADSV